MEIDEGKEDRNQTKVLSFFRHALNPFASTGSLCQYSRPIYYNTRQELVSQLSSYLSYSLLLFVCLTVLCLNSYLFFLSMFIQ